MYWLGKIFLEHLRVRDFTINSEEPMLKTTYRGMFFVKSLLLFVSLFVGQTVFADTPPAGLPFVKGMVEL